MKSEARTTDKNLKDMHLMSSTRISNLMDPGFNCVSCGLKCERATVTSKEVLTAIAPAEASTADIRSCST